MEKTSKPTLPRKPTWTNLGLRFVSAVILSAVCFSPFFFGGALWAILVALLGSRLVWEWVRMSDQAPPRLAYILPVAGLVVTITYCYLEFWPSALIAMAVTGLLAMVERTRRGEGGLWSGLGFLYIAIPCMVIVMLRGNEVGLTAPGFLLLIFLILIVVAADTGAYFGGSYFQGPKMAPKLSPKKTWSGFISGVLAGGIVGAITAVFIGFSPVTGGLLAMPVVILAVMGDFLESALKRRLEVKDTGGLLPGHGGLLDRMDSLMLVVVVAALMLWLWPGLWPL